MRDRQEVDTAGCSTVSGKDRWIINKVGCLRGKGLWVIKTPAWMEGGGAG